MYTTYRLYIYIYNLICIYVYNYVKQRMAVLDLNIILGICYWVL